MYYMRLVGGRGARLTTATPGFINGRAVAVMIEVRGNVAIICIHVESDPSLSSPSEFRLQVRRA
jgi:hypothetical protein